MESNSSNNGCQPLQKLNHKVGQMSLKSSKTMQFFSLTTVIASSNPLSLVKETSCFSTPRRVFVARSFIPLMHFTVVKILESILDENIEVTVFLGLKREEHIKINAPFAHLHQLEEWFVTRKGGKIDQFTKVIRSSSQIRTSRNIQDMQNNWCNNFVSELRAY